MDFPKSIFLSCLLLLPPLVTFALEDFKPTNAMQACEKFGADDAKMDKDLHDRYDKFKLANPKKPGEPPYSDFSSARPQSAINFKSCVAAARKARKMCLEMESVPLQHIMEIVGVGASLVKGMSNIKGTCAKHNELLTAAQLAATAYNGECGYFKMKCDDECGKLKELSLYGDIKGAIDDSQCLQACDDYGQNLTAVAVAVGQLGLSAAMGATCEKNVSEHTDPVVDCSKSENASNQKCICLENPHASGCTSASSSGSNMANSGVSDLPGTEGSKVAPPGPLADPKAIAATKPSTGTSDSALTGAGGAGLGAGGSTSGADAKADKAATGKGNGADSAGNLGGAGGSGIRGAGGYGDPTSGAGGPGSANKYQQFLPPATRGLATAGDITGKSGKSNWEKVKQTYTDISPKLISK